MHTFPAFVLRGGASVRVHSGCGTDDATNLYKGYSNYIWTNTAYLLPARLQRPVCKHLQLVAGQLGQYWVPSAGSARAAPQQPQQEVDFP